MIESSGVLYDNQQWFNANYLAGYVLECYCKLVLSYAIQIGQGVGRNNVRGYSHSIKSMKDDIDCLMISGTQISSYCIDLHDACSNILTHWNPNNRYESNSHVLGDKVLAEDIKKEVKRLTELVLKMDVDGVI